MRKVDQTLKALGYADAIDVRSRTSVADLFSKKDRCGVYVLEFSDGEFYAGKTKDIVRRYGQHRCVHNDIAYLRFRNITIGDIATFERELIWKLESVDFRLRNIQFTSMPKGESDFDDLMDPLVQKKFCSDARFQYVGNERNNDEVIRSKNDRRVDRLTSASVFSGALVMLRSYLFSCIPALMASEMSFWSATCLPDNLGVNGGVFVRINIFWQEVFNIYALDGDLYCSIFMCRAPIARKFGSGLAGADNFCRSFDDVGIGEHRYVPGGQDQINIFASNSSLTQLLCDPIILLAIREFNMRLMKKGPNNFSRSHCFKLIDRVFAEKSETAKVKNDRFPVAPKVIGVATSISRSAQRGWRNAVQFAGLRGWKPR